MKTSLYRTPTAQEILCSMTLRPRVMSPGPITVSVRHVYTKKIYFIIKHIFH
jgi:hypothetical protein